MLKPARAGLIVLVLASNASLARAQSVAFGQNTATTLQAVSTRIQEAATTLQPSVDEVAQDPGKAQFIVDKNRADALVLLKDQDDSLKSLALHELPQGSELQLKQTKDCQLTVGFDRETVTCALTTVISSDALRVVVDRYSDFAALLTDVSSDREIDLHVESQPSEALFSIHPLYGGIERSITTTAEIPSLIRGIYEYTVVKPGMKTISFPINFARDPRPRLHCTFVPAESAGPALPCTQLSQ